MKMVFMNKTKPLAWFLVLISIFWLGCSGRASAITASDLDNPNIVVVIDPGHGGENNGTSSGQTIEKEMTLATSLAMYDELSKFEGIDVYLTRETDVEKDISLLDRAKFAEEKQADFLFSIHYNASETHEMFGSEVWVSAFPPYNSCGYEFAYLQMQNMEELGLFLRGIKTRIDEDGNDYYGIIRECAKRSVPAVIIEHCYVDEPRDIPFCDSQEDWDTLGRTDAHSVAEYFGLKSSELGVDYSSKPQREEFDNLAKYAIIKETKEDLTRPDVCQITLLEKDTTTGKVSLEISAADYDSMLLYYDYSLDGGETFSIRHPWPNANIYDLTYSDTFTTTLQVPSGVSPQIVVRAYNMYDFYRTSNAIKIKEIFQYVENPASEDVVTADGTARNPSSNFQAAQTADNTVGNTINQTNTIQSDGPITFHPNGEGMDTAEEDTGFFTFLIVCLILVSILFVVVLVSQLIARHNRRSRW